MAFWKTCRKNYALLIALNILSCGAVHAETMTEDEKNQQKNKERLNAYVIRAPYFILPTLNIPIIRNNRLYGYLFVRIQFKAKTGYWSQISYFRHRLRHNLFVDLYGALSVLWNGESNPTPETIEKRAKDIAKKTFGENSLERVFILNLATEYKSKDLGIYASKNRR